MSDHPTALGGTCSARFDSLRELFAEKIASGEDLGASLAVHLDGRWIVDLWGGWADEARTTPWAEDTITTVFSSTKVMAALAALILVDRGELDLDAPVASYWPEFAARGKGAIKVRHLLAHSSGVSGWEKPITLDDLCDWDRSTAMLAAQAPWWEPGSASGYHALTFGHLIGEVIRRITGQRPGEFFAARIAGPLGADFHIGAPSSALPRISDVVPLPSLPGLEQLDPDSLAYKSLFNLSLAEGADGLRGGYSHSERWRRADIGSSNGHGNARSMARVQSVVSCGGTVDGVRLLSPETVERIFEPQSHGLDLVLGMPIKWGLGYGLPTPELAPFLPEGRLAFGAGAGGSLVIADADRRLTFAYAMNRMGPSVVGGPIAQALASRMYGIVGR